ncbi:MAG TPA: hypothetical protein PL155_03230 [Candidatus Omnitrophota bacterium]|nr:hypothetical protein [Candidatus Omnitrophota bacterium]HPD84507.1 hypothetical protein [Candidatus Omnitrophota bacterium]HRZ03365.1 hypothetical protein [Candidatus Omnitrophota bacterium]
MEYDFKKAVAFGLCILGLLIFYGVLTTKLDVMADQVRANVETISSKSDWENLLYKKAVIEASRNKQPETDNDQTLKEDLE